MKMFIIQSNEPVEGTFLNRSIQKEVGGGAPSLSENWDRKILQWSISSSGEIREQMEHHQSALTYHRGAKLFWFDGGVNGHIKTPQFLGYGNGVDTDFFIPYRNIFPQSLIMSQDYAVNSAWVLTPSTGMVRWNSPPAEGVMVHAEEFRCEFKGFFVVDSDKLYKMTDNFKSFITADIQIREFPY